MQSCPPRWAAASPVRSRTLLAAAQSLPDHALSRVTGTAPLGSYGRRRVCASRLRPNRGLSERREASDGTQATLVLPNGPKSLNRSKRTAPRLRSVARVRSRRRRRTNGISIAPRARCSPLPGSGEVGAPLLVWLAPDTERHGSPAGRLAHRQWRVGAQTSRFRPGQRDGFKHRG